MMCSRVGSAGETDEDTIDAGGGNDVVDADGLGSVTVDLGEGDDEFDGADGGAAEVSGEDGADELIGTPGPDELLGGDGADELYGVGGTDLIDAGLGDDILVGGTGVDSLDGGFGLNVCDYTATEPRTTTCTYDDDPPVMGPTTFSPDTVEVGTTSATTTLDLHLTDQTGIAKAGLSCHYYDQEQQRSHIAADIRIWVDDATDVTVAGATLLETRGTRRDLTLTLQATIEHGLRPGSYTCSNGVLTDILGHTQTSADPIGTLNVTRTGSGYDDDPPVMGPATFSPDTVEVGTTSATTTLDLHLTDQTGIAEAGLSCHHYDQEQQRSHIAADIRIWVDDATDVTVGGATLLETRGTRRDLTLTLQATIEHGLRPGTYTCSNGVLTDILGHTQTSADPIGTLNVTRTGSGYDDDPPVMGPTTFSPDTVEVGTTSATTTLDLHLTDQTGIAKAGLSCHYYDEEQQRSHIAADIRIWVDDATDVTVAGATLLETRGTRRDLTLTLQATIEHGLRPGSYTCSNGVLTDILGHTQTSADPIGTLDVTRTPPGQPTAPGSVAFSPTRPTSGVLRWTAPTFLGDPALQDYEIQVRLAEGAWTTLDDGVGTSTTLPVDNLSAGTTYQFRCRGENGGRAGTWSDVAAATMPAAEVPDVPTGVTATPASHSEADVSWLAPDYNGGRPITDFAVGVSTDRGATWRPVPHAPTSATSMRIRGLSGRTGYWVRVGAVNAVGTGRWSEAATFETPSGLPSPPRNLTSVVTGPRALRLSWEGPVDLGGTPLITYRVEKSTDHGVTWQQLPHPLTTSTSMDVAGLARGTSYELRVRAETSVGPGPYSAAVPALLPRVAPSEPVDLMVRAGTTTPTSVTLAWRSPADTGGASITNYRLEITANSGRSWVLLRRPPAPRDPPSSTASGRGGPTACGSGPRTRWAGPQRRRG